MAKKNGIPRRKQKDGPAPDEVIVESDVQLILDDKLILDTTTPEDNIKLRNDEIYSLWEQNMHDFVPEDMSTFLVDGKSAEVFYENISHQTPTAIKGAYYVHGAIDARPISVVVQDPEKTIIYKRSDEIQGIILFNSTVPGDYTIIFANFDDSVEKTVTLAIHTYDADDEPISYDFDENG